MIHFYTFFDLGEEISSIGEKLIPNWFAFLVQLVALIVLLIIIFVFAYKPVKALLDKRADYIEKEVKDAEENKRIAEKNALESEQLVIDSKKKANEIIKDATLKAENNSRKILDETNQTISKMKRDAEEDIAKSKEQSLKDIHDEMVDVALDASKEILKREVNEKDSRRLAKDFIDDLGK